MTAPSLVDRPVDEGHAPTGQSAFGRNRVNGESRVPPPAASTIPARLSGMETRRWLNPSQPQTLQIAVFLLYINAFFSVLGGYLGWIPWGIALIVCRSEAASASRTSRSGATGSGSPPPSRPSLLRWLFLGPSHVFGANIINLMFEVALVALLLHPMSRDYERIWFK